MGIALIVPDISFAGANLGQVTPLSNVPLTGLAISGDASVVGGADAAQYTAIYTPANTTQRAVAWSVESGSAYASIDPSTGMLTVLPGASAASVTIRVTSLVDSSIYADKTITVTHSGVIIMSTIKFDGQSAIDTGIKADMPTDIQVTMAQMSIEDWGILDAGSGTRTAVIIGGRDGNAYNRRDIQLSATAQTNNINAVVFGVGDTSKNIEGLSLPKGNELYVSQGPTHYTVNNDVTPRTAQGTFTSNTNYVIGAQNTGGTIAYTYASYDKFKRVKIFATEGGTLLGDFVPAIDNGVHGMYDYVSGQFFTNIGTGTLVCE